MEKTNRQGLSLSVILMALSKIQKILEDAITRSAEYDILEYVPVWFYSDSNELRIGSPVSESEVNPINPAFFKRADDVVYNGTDLLGREGRASIKESIADIATGKDIRVFVDSPSNRVNGEHVVFEYNAYFQFDKFLNNISNFTKLRMKDKRVKFRPKCKTAKYHINEDKQQ